MRKPRKLSFSQQCPTCQNALLYDGKGFSCMACAYVLRGPDSDRAIQCPPRNSPKK